ncbi:Fructosamine kinase-domain-containing protein [Xylaria digitata]|nr:Fructosamine kinase-domain-containing protein [Xylaria digitata]
MGETEIQIPFNRTVSPSSRSLKLDSAVYHRFRYNEEIITVIPHGNANWAATMKITTQTTKHTAKEYFLKIVTGELAEERVLGEYNCMSELYHTVPSILLMPYSAGKCLDNKGYYFLSEFVPIVHRAPNAVQLGEQIAKLHRDSHSPTGKFGFATTPYDGKLPLMVDWDSSWVSFYCKLLYGVYPLDSKFNGKWRELDEAMVITLDQVIPRLLGPLKEGGRTIKPCLIHGDLWEDNIGTDSRTGGILSLTAMNASEYRDEYFKNYPPDEPVAECDDRNRLYSIKENLMYSALRPGHAAREQALADMEYLICKYTDTAE